MSANPSEFPLFPVFTDEHKALRRAVREFAEQEIAPIAAALDERAEFPLATIRQMGEMGLMGIEVPEEFGGVGMDALAYVLTMVEIARADASHAAVVSVNNSLYDGGLVKYGTAAQKDKFLRPVASGKAIGAYSLTEPMSGSDAATMESRAVLSEDGTHYRLYGRKSWVTSGPVADFVIVFMMTSPELGVKGITAFLVDLRAPGVVRGREEHKLGIRASATSELLFEDCAVPVDQVLGKPGDGFRIAMALLDAGRIGIASQALGISEAAYEAALIYARERRAFGGPIGQLQMIQQKLADMKTRIEASRLLIYQAAGAKERSKVTGERYTTAASMAKLFASETAMFVTDEALQIHGGLGYSKEAPVERYWRDARITRIYEGTSEVQRLVIARAELGLR
ncbi:MAG: acyl-CoA dehydrogenase family protein [Anaerolineae bacterium]